MKSLKTPLRYPGGKSRAVIKMDPYFPDLRNYEEFREPFLGGGSVAIHITKKYPDLKIVVNDLYEPLYNFWVQLQTNSFELVTLLTKYKEDYPDPPKQIAKYEADRKKQDKKYKSNLVYPAKQLFSDCKKKIDDIKIDSIERAAFFYIINKCSFSGLTVSSSFSEQASINNFTQKGIDKLLEYSNLISKWHINQHSYDWCMENNVNDKVFIYLDPPYDIKDNLYGNNGSMHKGFDHDKFTMDCDSCSMHQLISYNSDQLVKDRFKNWNMNEFDLTYTMRSVGQYMREQKERKELLLFNYEL
jgi:DNA adenine methylase